MRERQRAGNRLPARGKLERAKGIEPSYTAWEAVVLPLNYARDRRLSKAASLWPRLQRASATEIRHTFLIRTAFRCNGRHAGLSAGLGSGSARIPGFAPITPRAWLSKADSGRLPKQPCGAGRLCSTAA